MQKQSSLRVCAIAAASALGAFALYTAVRKRRTLIPAARNRLSNIWDGLKRKPVLLRASATINRPLNEVQTYIDALDSDFEVQLKPAPAGRGTEITALTQVSSGFGRTGETVLRLTAGTDLEKKLSKIKQIIETGETARAKAS